MVFFQRVLKIGSQLFENWEINLPIGCNGGKWSVLDLYRKVPVVYGPLVAYVRLARLAVDLVMAGSPLTRDPRTVNDPSPI